MTAIERIFATALTAVACLVSSKPVEAQLLPLAPAEGTHEPVCLALGSLELPELAAIEAAWNRAVPAAVRDDALLPGEPLALPAHCRVRGTVLPAIGFEVWLPAPEAWNGRFLAVGSGNGGSLSYERMRSALAQGYATASTDTGHRAGDFSWLADDARLRDFGYRAVFEMTAKAAAIVPAFYARPADYRYFNGCSLGGRQGLMEAQRFPSDYDGIVAGAPASVFVDAGSTELWSARAARPAAGAGSLLGPDELELVNDAAVAQCDTLDGVLDGVLEDPRRCSFDPARLQCGIAAGARCLTPVQVNAVRQIHAGPTDAETGLRLPGFALGSEPGWTFATSAEPSPLTLEFFRRAVFDDPFWAWQSFDFPEDHLYAEEETGWMLNAASTDLSRFRDHGGKLVLYHGWNDADVSPEATIAWYEALEASLDGDTDPLEPRTRDFVRLFMVPGMSHCAGGIGTDQFDAQRALEDWVERGLAPDRIEAERVESGEVTRTRPLCPYPEIARYRGSANSDRSGSFICAN